MKVVEGNFGKPDGEEAPTLAESIAEVLELTELGPVKQGRFLLIVDTDDRMSFMTNELCPEGTVYLLEQVKHAVITGGIGER